MTSIYRALYCTGGCAIIQIILILSALYAYQVNARKAPDDPKKRVYSPYAPWLAPLTPFLWLGRLIILVPWCIPFGIFLVLFPLLLIVFRPLSPNDPFKRFILKLGNGILKVNTRLLSGLGLQQPQLIRSLSYD